MGSATVMQSLGLNRSFDYMRYVSSTMQHMHKRIRVNATTRGKVPCFVVGYKRQLRLVIPKVLRNFLSKIHFNWLVVNK